MTEIKKILEILDSRLSYFGQDELLQLSETLKNKELSKQTDLFEDFVQEAPWEYVPSMESELNSMLKNKQYVPYIIQSTDEYMEIGCTRKMMLEYAFVLYATDMICDDVVRLSKMLVLTYIKDKLKLKELDTKYLAKILTATKKRVVENGYAFCLGDIGDILFQCEEVKKNV